MAVDEVNEVRFWGERQIKENVTHWPQGQILNRAVTLEVAQSPAAGEPAVMRVCNSWLGRGAVPILAEETTIAIRKLPATGYHLLEYLPLPSS